MTSMNVSLPPAMRDFIRAECERYGYSTASEYVRALIRAAQLGRLDVAVTLPVGARSADRSATGGSRDRRA